MAERSRRLGEDLPRRGLAPKTQPCDVDAVKQLAHHDRRSPDPLSEEELRQSVLCLLHGKTVADSTFRMQRYGITCLYETTLPRPWPVFALVRPHHPRLHLPSHLRSSGALCRYPHESSSQTGQAGLTCQTALSRGSVQHRLDTHAVTVLGWAPRFMLDTIKSG